MYFEALCACSCSMLLMRSREGALAEIWHVYMLFSTLCLLMFVLLIEKQRGYTFIERERRDIVEGAERDSHTYQLSLFSLLQQPTVPSDPFRIFFECQKTTKMYGKTHQNRQKFLPGLCPGPRWGAAPDPVYITS